jgi:mannose-6-phosphate isomerase-like protein (cupin superfamily)
MPVRRYFTGFLLGLLSLSASAQQASLPAAGQRPVATDPAMAEALRVYVAAPEVAKLIAQAEAADKAGSPPPSTIGTLVSWGPLAGHVIYRNKPTELYFANEDYAEFYVILDGEGTMSLGGVMTDPKRTGFRSESPALKGGVPYKVTRGAMIMVPPGTAHRVTEVHGKLVYMSMHIPVQPGSNKQQ